MTRRAGSGETSRIAGLTYAFCVAAGTEVRKLIAGRGVFIGDRCADLADEVDMDGDRRTQSSIRDAGCVFGDRGRQAAFVHTNEYRQYRWRR